MNPDYTKAQKDSATILTEVKLEEIIETLKDWDDRSVEDIVVHPKDYLGVLLYLKWRSFLVGLGFVVFLQLFLYALTFLCPYWTTRERIAKVAVANLIPLSLYMIKRDVEKNG